MNFSLFGSFNVSANLGYEELGRRLEQPASCFQQPQLGMQRVVLLESFRNVHVNSFSILEVSIQECSFSSRASQEAH